MEGRRASRDERIQASWAEVQRLAAEAEAAAAARRPRVCGNCKLYIRCDINPEAAIGSCEIGHLYHFPEERHHCRDHKPT
ncbi:hypothetical protein [Dyella sp. 2RAB6]|uniref:hypothetical protein n=1 Tax=Dyella sp. 2RAB6 TaxID=3232992 RepID=UPI003F93731C